MSHTVAYHAEPEVTPLPLDKSFGVVPVCLTNEGLRVLIIRHNAGHWGFPKGHPEAGETPIQAARRELAEETGITECRLVVESHFSERYHFLREGRPMPKLVRYYLGWVRMQEVTPQVEELLDAMWATEKEALTKLTHRNARRILHAALKAAEADMQRRLQ